MSGSFGPFATRAGILQRSTDFIDLVIRNTPEANMLRLWGAGTLNDAYGNLAGSGVGGTGDVQLMEGFSGSITQSVEAARRWRVEESRRGQTSFQFDVRDFGLGPGSIGSDDEYLFIRVQEHRSATGAWLTVAAGPNAGWPIKGPILVVPPASFFGLGGAAITLYGTAPAGTTSVPGAIPVLDETVNIPIPMHIIFPRPVTSIQIRGIDPINDLLFSYGLGMPMSIAHGDVSIFGAPGISEVVLASGDGSIGAGACLFSIEAVIDLYDK